ncbi:MAG: DNA cytosine methyltransferase [Zoogloeaceae bacterium]|jgi:DNA (cytosine-5)-methyltransferase 1|nr:DNA cytosine methyltransferase [Zoogloeaceae bacterium]
MNATPQALCHEPALLDREEDGRLTFLDFFAGSGLVSHALSPYFKAIWANDICPKKAAVFMANHDDTPFAQCSVTAISGRQLPFGLLSWASFPCQDLSLAGNIKGIQAKRSGLVWEWLRVMDEMPRRPPVLAAENVSGLVSANKGAHYRELHEALARRGYSVGALLLDAARWLPQSRPRVFVVAVDSRLPIPETLVSDKPTWAHSAAIQKVSVGLEDWIWWRLPEPEKRDPALSGIVDYSLACHDAATIRKNLALIPAGHMRRLEEKNMRVVPGYKRIRNGKQVLELRFDDIAGCLRTPAGGSSRQYLVMRQGDEWKTRILSPREAARLMGAPETFKLPGTPNDGYKAMGDAVAAPVAAHLAEHLLFPLARAHNDIF